VGHKGAELGADCLDLWEAGYYELKPLGQTFNEAARQLDRHDASLILYRSSELGGPYGPVVDVWSDFRDDVFAILRETAENLDLTGDALMLAAREYMSSDKAAADKFRQLQPALIAGHPEKEPPK
jgi:hypothetical protein